MISNPLCLKSVGCALLEPIVIAESRVVKRYSCCFELDASLFLKDDLEDPNP